MNCLRAHLGRPDTKHVSRFTIHNLDDYIGTCLCWSIHCMYMSGNAHCIQIFHSIQSHLIIPFLIWLHFVFLWVHSKPLHCYFFVVCAETTLSDVHRLIRKKSLIKFVLCPNCTSSGPQLQIRKLLSRLDERFCRESMYLDLTNQQSIWGWNDNFKNFSNKKKYSHSKCLPRGFVSLWN